MITGEPPQSASSGSVADARYCRRIALWALGSFTLVVVLVSSLLFWAISERVSTRRHSSTRGGSGSAIVCLPGHGSPPEHLPPVNPSRRIEAETARSRETQAPSDPAPTGGRTNGRDSSDSHAAGSGVVTVPATAAASVRDGAEGEHDSRGLGPPDDREPRSREFTDPGANTRRELIAHVHATVDLSGVQQDLLDRMLAKRQENDSRPHQIRGLPEVLEEFRRYLTAEQSRAYDAIVPQPH